MPARRARLNLVNLFLWVLGGGILALAAVGRVPDAVPGADPARAMAEPHRRRHRTGQRVRPHRPRLHARLRHPLHDQLRPRRGVHVGRLHRVLRGHRPQRRGHDRRQPGARVPAGAADRDAGQHARGDPARARRVSAVAGCATPRPAHHGHRRLAVPAVHGARLLRLRRARLSRLRAVRRHASSSARSESRSSTWW